MHEQLWFLRDFISIRLQAKSPYGRGPGAPSGSRPSRRVSHGSKLRLGGKRKEPPRRDHQAPFTSSNACRRGGPVSKSMAELIQFSGVADSRWEGGNELGNGRRSGYPMT
ncbi:hypothetical protein NDU88_006755 [Pleurodeles waltl]|uniref:Uncharacterized protein n=1 Tax=Pleurodeles waltl TaxID=8319 RepID=A0AAV7SQF8_PLEWA|nr:hypothetical protein NDU88_006755 [Pleurodeles waltl]